MSMEMKMGTRDGIIFYRAIRVGSLKHWSISTPCFENALAIYL